MLLQALCVCAHLLAGEPDFDLPWDLDLQEKTQLSRETEYAGSHVWDSRIHTQWDEHCHAEYTESCKFPGFCLPSFQRILFTQRLHMLLCILVWSLGDDQFGWCRWQEHRNNQNPDQYFQRVNKKPGSKLACFIRLEQHLPLQLQTAHSEKYLLCEVPLIYPLTSSIFLTFEFNPY